MPTPIRSAHFLCLAFDLLLFGFCSCSLVSSLTRVCERGSQRERDRERAAARKPNAKGPQDGLTPEQRRERWVSSISFYPPYASCLICSCVQYDRILLVPADPFPIRLVGSSLIGTRKRWRRRRPRRRSRRRPAPPVPPRTTRTRVAARSRRHQHARRNLCTIIDAYLRIFVDAMFVGS